MYSLLAAELHTSPLAGPPLTSFPTPPAAAPAAQPESSEMLSSRPGDRRRRPPKYIITSDVHYDAEARVLSFILELPGVKKTELSVELSTCLLNNVKQLKVSGTSRPTFEAPLPFSAASAAGASTPSMSGSLTMTAGSLSHQMTVRERKYGDYSRTFAVPPGTKVRLSSRYLFFSCISSYLSFAWGWRELNVFYLSSFSVFHSLKTLTRRWRMEFLL